MSVRLQSAEDMDTTHSSPDRSHHDTGRGVLDWCSEDDSSIQEPESGTVFAFVDTLIRDCDILYYFLNNTSS